VGDVTGLLRVGCAMWAHRPWIGTAFPATTRTGHELESYCRMFRAVEGNTTFYALPSERTVSKWAEQSLPSFRFVFKVPRTITHEHRLRGAEGELREFLDRIVPLGERLGPISVQLPASFGPSDVGVLRGFLSGLPRAFRWAVEVRHPAFAEPGAGPRLDELMRLHDVDRVVLDSRALFAGPCVTVAEQAAFRSKPRLPVRPIVTARHPIVRFIGCSELDANPEYWKPWVTRVATWLTDGVEPYVFLHTPDNDEAPTLARRFHAAVAELVPDIAPCAASDVSSIAAETGASDSNGQERLW
jgi:uncharacterized protein YecE (DUF72 family)